jgi:hypothetical protein
MDEEEEPMRSNGRTNTFQVLVRTNPSPIYHNDATVSAVGGSGTVLPPIDIFATDNVRLLNGGDLVKKPNLDPLEPSPYIAPSVAYMQYLAKGMGTIKLDITAVVQPPGWHTKPVAVDLKSQVNISCFSNPTAK